MIGLSRKESLRGRFAESGATIRIERKKEGPADSSESLSQNTPTGRRSGTVGDTEASLTGVPSQSISKHYQAAEKRPSTALPGRLTISAAWRHTVVNAYMRSLQGISGSPQTQLASACLRVVPLCGTKAGAFLSTLRNNHFSTTCKSVTFISLFNLLIEGDLILCGGGAFSPLLPIGYS